MRTYFILLLVCIQMMGMTIPASITRNGFQFFSLRAIAPCLGITYSYNKTENIVSVNCTSFSISFDYNEAVKNGKNPNNNSSFIIPPDFPGRIYISKNRLNQGGLFVYEDKIDNSIVIFNLGNGGILELHEFTTHKMLISLNPPPKNPKKWDIVKLEDLLSRHPEFIKENATSLYGISQMEHGTQLLYIAIENNDIASMTVLLNAGVSPGVDNGNSSSDSPLLFAVKQHNSKAVELLLSRGASTASDELLNEAIGSHLGGNSENMDIVKLLIKYKANPDSVDEEGLSVLHIAVFWKNIEIARLLIDNGANVNIVDKEKKYMTTPLMVATEPGLIIFSGFAFFPTKVIREYADYLISAGADINAQDIDGHTVICNAAKLLDFNFYKSLQARKDFKPLNKEHQSQLMIELLASAVIYEEQYSIFMKEYQTNEKSDKNKAEIVNNPVYSAENMAILAKKIPVDLPAIFADLLARGVDVNIKDKDNKSSLDYAVMLKDTMYAQKLIDAGSKVDKDTILSAITSLNPSGTEFLLQKGVNIKQWSPYFLLDNKSEDGRIDYDLKVKNHDAIIVMTKLFIKYKADMTIRDNDEKWGGQAIHHAAKSGYPDLMELLLDNGADIEAVDKNGNTPLCIAASASEIETMEVLIKHGAIINVRDKDGRSPLSRVIAKRNIDGIKLLLNQPGIDVKMQDNNGNTILITAVCDDPDIIPDSEFLFNNDEYVKWLPTLVKELIKLGCNVNVIDTNGTSPLGFAACENDVKTMEVLVKSGAKINVRDKDGDSPLSRIIANRNIDGIKLLLNQPGIDVKTRDNNGNTLLIIAECDDPDIVFGTDFIFENEEYERWIPTLVKELIKLGCNVNGVNNEGSSPLHYAVLYRNSHHTDDDSVKLRYEASIGNKVIAQILLAHGANINLTDNDGNTPLHTAILKEMDTPVTLFLLKNGANVNARNREGLSPLDIANRDSRTEHAAILRKFKGKAWKYKKLVEFD